MMSDLNKFITRDPLKMSKDDWFHLHFEAMEVFTPGAPIDEKELFAGRLEQIKSLLDIVCQKGRHAIIYGERGVGKTSLANTFHLTLTSPTGGAFIIKINCDPSDNFSTLWKKIFKRINVNLDGEEFTLADMFDGQICPDDIQIELGKLKKFNPIIIIDEFDRILDENTKTMMSDTIKALSDYSVNVTLLLVGVAESINQLINKHESISRALIQVQMPRMEQDEISDIVIKGVTRLGMTISDDALWKIKLFAKGLPYYAHSFGLYAVRSAVEDKKLRISETHVDKAIHLVIENIDQTIKELYDKATYTAKKDTIFKQVLLACALAETDKLGRFPANAVVKPLEQIMGKKYEIPSFSFHLNEYCSDERGPVLDKFGLPRKYKFRFIDPIIQPFIIMEGIKEGIISQETAEQITLSRQPSFLLPEN